MAETDFEFDVDMTGVSTANVTNQDPPGGPHEIEIVGVQAIKNDKSGKTSLTFDVAVVGGDAAGISTQVRVGMDFSKPFNKSHLMNCLHGLHNAAGKFTDPARFTGVLKLKLSMFRGARAFMFTKAPMAGEIDEEGKTKRADNNFISKAQYDAAVKAAAIGGPKAAPAPVQAPASSPAPTQAAPVPTAPAPQGLGDLFGS